MEHLPPERVRSLLARFGSEKQQVTRTPDELYEDEMERASVLLRESIQLARDGWTPRSGRELIWNRYSGSDMDNCSGAKGEGYQYVEVVRPARRDPCPMCGTRMDIGCKHTARGF